MRTWLFGVLSASALVPAVLALQIDVSKLDTVAAFEKADQGRESLQNATGILEAMKIQPGDWVADIGAGGGYYSMRMAELAGASGKVFAEDIEERAIGYISQRIRTFGLRNVEAVQGDPADPRLPPGRIASVLAIDTFHHFTDPAAMLGKILASLKPDGRFVIADYSTVESRRLPRSEQVRKFHQIDPEIVTAEAERAGFRKVTLVDPFVKWKTALGNTRGSPTDLWLMVLVRAD